MKARYLFAGRTRITLDGSTRQVTYDERSVGFDGRDRRGLVGLDFGMEGRLTGTVRLGVVSVNMAEKPDFRGVIGDAGLAYKYGRGSSLRLDAGRDALFTVYSDPGFYVQTQGRLGNTTYLNRFFGIDAGYSRYLLRFPGFSRVDHLRAIDGGVRIRLSENELGRRIEYLFKLTRYRRDSTIDALDSTRTVFGFGAVVGY